MPLVKNVKPFRIKLRQDLKRSWSAKMIDCDRRIARKFKYSIGL